MTISIENLLLPSLRGKVVFLTGAGRGIGKAMALGFLSVGANLFGVARSALELSVLQADAGESQFAFAVGDLAEPKLAADLVRRAVQVFGTIDVLVNNAGVGSGENPRPIADFDDRFWDYTLAVNLTAPYLLSKAAIPYLARRGAGRIINVASLAGKVGLLHGAAYAASKHGLLGLTRTLAIELAPSRITANAICPGVVRTQSNDRRIQYDSRRTGVPAETLESGLNPLGRRLLPEEIVPLALFLASDAGSIITGQAYNVDGGAAMF
jgi:NAD(P)-dependent dehydrogenase (short-subunit alcohol dehydrogenase family)